MARRLAIILAMAMATLAFGQGPFDGWKKDKQAPKERTVEGTVTDADGNALPGAVVQMKNLKTLQVRSFIAKEKGDYYFQGLPMDDDFEFQARYNGKESEARRVSSFDNHPSVTVNLKIRTS